MSLPDLRPALPKILDPKTAVPPFTPENWHYNERCPICKVNRKTRRMSSCQKCIDKSLYQDKFDNINKLRDDFVKQKKIHEDTQKSLQKTLNENQARLAIVSEKYSLEESDLQKLADALDKEEQNIILQVDVLSNDIRLYHSTDTDFELETHCTIVRPPNIHKDIYFGHVTLIIADSNSEFRWHYGIKPENNLPDDLNNIFWSTPPDLRKSNVVLIEDYGTFGFQKGTTLERIMLNHFVDCFNVFDKKQWTRQIWNDGDTEQKIKDDKMLNRLKKLEKDRKWSDQMKRYIQDKQAEETGIRLEQEDTERRIRREQEATDTRIRLEQEKKDAIIVRRERITEIIKQRAEEAKENLRLKKIQEEKDKQRQDDEDKERIENAIKIANIERAEIQERADRERADRERAETEDKLAREKVYSNFKKMQESIKQEIQYMIDEDRRIFDLDQTDDVTHAARKALISRHEAYDKSFREDIKYMKEVSDNLVKEQLISMMIHKLYKINECGRTDERIKILKLEDEIYTNGGNTTKNESDNTLIDILMNKITDKYSLDSTRKLVKQSRETNPDGISIAKFLRLLRNEINREDTINKMIDKINSLIPSVNDTEKQIDLLLKKGKQEDANNYREALIKVYNMYVRSINHVKDNWKQFELSEETNRKIEGLLKSEAMDWERRLSLLTLPDDD